MRILLAETAYNAHHVEAWDVPGAYMHALRHSYDSNEPRQTLLTPPWADGRPILPPSSAAVADEAVPGTPDAG